MVNYSALVNTAIRSGVDVSDFASLLQTCMVLGEGKYNPKLVIKEINTQLEQMGIDVSTFE